MTEPTWPEHGGEPDRYYPLHYWTSPSGAHHAGQLLDTVIGPSIERSGEQQIYEILRCYPCLAIHVTPLPSQEALAQYYATQFFQHDKPEYLERYERDRRWWEFCVHGPLLRQAMSECTSLHMPLSVMEVGAGPGIALDVARQLGCETYAVEPSLRCALLLQEHGHKVWNRTFETFGGSGGTSHGFDVIYLYEVLEHQPCPEEFVLRCYDLLEPGGILVCVVPNDFNPLQLEACARFGLPRYWLAPPQHLFFWTPKTLQLHMRRCGFQQITMRGSYPLERFMLDDGVLYVGNDALGREIHQRRMTLELHAVAQGCWQDLEAQYCATIRQRMGREIVSLWRKNLTPEAA